jgi:hypothetical protein
MTDIVALFANIELFDISSLEAMWGVIDTLDNCKPTITVTPA